MISYLDIMTVIGIKKSELDTPCLIIEKEALHYNLNLMRSHGLENGINIRPHCKTHKCSKLAQLQLDYGAIGISAAKISEAETLITNNITSILVTSPVVTKYKIQKLLDCAKLAPDIMVVVDNEQNLHDLNNAFQTIQQKLNVLVDINSGIGRTGVTFDQAVRFAQKIMALDWLNLKGIQCYAGNLQHIASYKQRREMSLGIMQQASELVKIFRAQGLPCSILTGTGTGTFDIDNQADEVTEIQAGSYVVMDVEYRNIECKDAPLFTTFKPAMTLLSTVISSNHPDHVTVDAGTKALYVSPCKPLILSHPDLHYDWGGFGDEHGKITATNNAILPSNGAVIEMIVPHCDPTINLFDQFYIVDRGVVIDVWDIDLRGKSQ